MPDAKAGMGRPSYPGPSSWTVAAVQMTAGAVLMSLYLGEKGLWLDEALSVARASADLGPLWQEITASQANMGLYYLALHVWLALGTTEAAVRSLSVVFAVLTILIVYRLTARLFGETAGRIAGVLLAFNPFFIRYAQEARGYSLAVLLVCAASYCLVRGLDQPSRRTWAACVLLSVLAVYAHFFSALVLLAHLTAVVALGRARVLRAPLVATGAAIGLGIAPAAAFVLFRDAGQIDWVPAPRVVDLYHLVAAFAGGSSVLLGGYAIATGAALSVALRRTAAFRSERWPALFVATWLVVPIAVAFGVSQAKPIFQSRFLIVVLPAFVMLAGAGLSRLRRPAGQATVAGLVVLLSAASVRDFYQEPERQYWRRAARDVLTDARPGDAITFYVYSGRVPFEYYLDRLNLRKPGVDLVDVASGPWMAGNRQPEPSEARLDALAGRHARVWLVRLQDGGPPGHPLGRHEQSQRIRSALASQYDLAHSLSYPGGITVELYDR